MDSILYVSISQTSLPIVTPLQFEKLLNKLFGETIVIKPLTKKEMKKNYEDYRGQRLKDKTKINQIATFKEYSVHKKKTLKIWRGEQNSYKKDWNYSYRISCFIYSLITYYMLIRTCIWFVRFLRGKG
tara:strand:- start:22 stop:405 length:384 start_codon:yes stop_codon:yes gene_type:complete